MTAWVPNAYFIYLQWCIIRIKKNVEHNLIYIYNEIYLTNISRLYCIIIYLIKLPHKIHFNTGIILIISSLRLIHE